MSLCSSKKLENICWQPLLIIETNRIIEQGRLNAPTASSASEHFYLEILNIVSSFEPLSLTTPCEKYS